MNEIDVVYTEMDSTTGPILLARIAKGLTHISFQNGIDPLVPKATWRREDRTLRGAVTQLRAYFGGELREFDLPLVPKGTPFQERVWTALQTIPYGVTITYGELAKRIGMPSAARAVGAANGKNPLPIIIPCHRVIGTDGKLVGFSSGLPIKQTLLDLERTAGQTQLSLDARR